MARMLEGAVSGERLLLDEVSIDTLQTVWAAARYAYEHGYGAIQTCTDAYHQPRVRMLFAMMKRGSCPVRIVARGSKQLQAKMWLRELVAIPYDAVAGLAAVWRASRRSE